MRAAACTRDETLLAWLGHGRSDAAACAPAAHKWTIECATRPPLRLVERRVAECRCALRADVSARTREGLDQLQEALENIIAQARGPVAGRGAARIMRQKEPGWTGPKLIVQAPAQGGSAETTDVLSENRNKQSG